MKVLFDNRWLGKTGIGRYAVEILKRSPQGIEIVMLNGNYPIKDPLTPLRLSASIRRICPDMFWSPGFMPPLCSSVPFVFTIHDMIHLRFGNSFHRAYYRHVIRRITKRAMCVLTVSEYSRRQILEWSGLTQDKVIAIPLGVGPEFCETGPSYDMGTRYILYVGNRRIYKNLGRMIRAFSTARIDGDIKLALTGSFDAELYSLALKQGVADRLRFLGVVPEEELPSLYRGALALMYVSLYEGFGLPPLEAMACGTPVVVSNTTSLPEVVGQAGLMVDPMDEADIADALGMAINDRELRARLKQQGLEQAKKFSWDRCAGSTWRHVLAAYRAWSKVSG